MHLDWHTVKELDKMYMSEQLRLAGHPTPKVIGIDEISIGRGISTGSWSATCTERAIWFGGDGRTERHGPVLCIFRHEKRQKIRLAVMDMWKPSAIQRKRMLRKLPFCSTNSMYCVISARLG